MGLNARAIETLSINAVKDSITMCDFLAPYIADNDKEPSWDGAVYIYESKNHKKENLKGRMPVQVKGKECDDLIQEQIAYPVSTIDLKNYLYDGGIIFFVVYIGLNGLEKKIYYIELTPIKLRIALTEAEDQKTKSLKLKEFPIDNNKKATIFLNCLQNCQKQASFTDAKLFSIEELKKKGVLEGITVPISAIGVSDPQRALLTNEVYIYAKIRGCSIPQPLELIPHNMVTNQEQNINIIIGDRIYYNKIHIIKTAEYTTFKIGESITINLFDENKPFKINYRNSTKVRTLAIDLDFMISYIEIGYFKMDGIKIRFDYSLADFSNFNMEIQKKHLEFAKNVVETLDILNCKKDIDIGELNTEDMRNLERLITAFVDKKPVMNLKQDLPPVIKMNIRTLSLALCLQACENLNNTYNIYDFFKTEMSVVYDDINGEKLPISQYTILNADDLLTLDNIRFDALLPSFQKEQKHYDTYNRANWFLLDLLTAYDKSCGTRIEILRTAYDFANWILHDANEEELPYQVKRLNYLQVIKRMREFEISEVVELYSLIGCCSNNEEMLVGIYLLLGQQEEAEIHFNKLSPTIQDNFRTYPIYHFWKKAEELQN